MGQALLSHERDYRLGDHPRRLCLLALRQLDDLNLHLPTADLASLHEGVDLRGWYCIGEDTIRVHRGGLRGRRKGRQLSPPIRPTRPSPDGRGSCCVKPSFLTGTPPCLPRRSEGKRLDSPQRERLGSHSDKHGGEWTAMCYPVASKLTYMIEDPPVPARHEERTGCFSTQAALACPAGGRVTNCAKRTYRIPPSSRCGRVYSLPPRRATAICTGSDLCLFRSEMKKKVADRSPSVGLIRRNVRPSWPCAAPDGLWSSACAGAIQPFGPNARCAVDYRCSSAGSALSKSIRPARELSNINTIHRPSRGF